MSEELNRKQEHLASLEDFLQSPAFLGFKAGVKEDIQLTKDSIVSIDPARFEDFVEECKLRGELRVLEQLENVFEEARVTLKSRIDAMVEAELENATNTRK
jgi:hypothetical protein